MTENRHAALGIHGAAADGSHEHHAPHRGPILRRAKWTGAIVIGLLLAGAVVTMVMRSVARPRAGEVDRRTGEAVRHHRQRQHREKHRASDAAGHAAGHHRVADLRARQRLRAALEGRHRRARQQGRRAGRNRHAGSGPAAVAGGRRAPAGRLQPGAGQEFGRALGSAAQEGRRHRAGTQRAHQRLHAGAWPTWPPPTPTCAACRRPRNSSASSRPSPASSPAAPSTWAT